MAQSVRKENIIFVHQIEKFLFVFSLLEKQCETVRFHLTEAVGAYEEKPRDQWIIEYPAQVALTGSQIWWTVEVCAAFAKLEEGYENALKDFYRKQVAQLNALITHLLGDLTSGLRQKIMTICTVSSRFCFVFVHFSTLIDLDRCPRS